MEREDDDRNLSFSYDIGGENLRLIDVSREDDFLIDSPLFDSLEDLRLSVTFDSMNEHEDITVLGSQSSQEGNNTEETILQKEQNLSPSGAMKSRRPSYLRKSLAWDSAFFDSAGVLEPDELTLINRGLKAVEGIRMNRAETVSAVSGSRKIEGGHQNKTKPTSQRHRIRRSDRTKIEHGCRREKASLKPPKPSEGMENLFRGQTISASLNEYDAEIKNKTATRSGKRMMHCRRSALVNSCCLPSGYLSSPTFSSVFPVSTNDNTVTLSPYETPISGSSRKVPSALVKGKTESQVSKICASTSTPETPPKLLKKSKELGYPRLSTLSKSVSNSITCISPSSSSDMTFSTSTWRSKQQPNDLEAYLDTSVVWRAGLQSGALQGSNVPNTLQRKSSLSLQCEEIKSPAQMNTESLGGASSISSESRKKLKPSGLRQPSPKIGFFDDEKAMFAKANCSLQFQFEMENTSSYNNGPVNRKRPAKLPLDKTSPETKTLKHSWKSCLLHSAPGIKGRNTSSDKRLWNSSPRVSSTMKSRSTISLRHHNCKCAGTEGEICSNSRKVDARECGRERVGQTSGLMGEHDQRQVKGRLKKRLGIENRGQRDDMGIQREVRNQRMEVKSASQQAAVDDLHLLNEDKTRNPTNWEDQVNDLSRYFDIIDLSKDVLMEFKGNNIPTCLKSGDCSAKDHMDISSPSFDWKNILDDQHLDLPNISPNPSRSSLSMTDILQTSRTPLADKTSICNRNGSFTSSVESTKGRLVAKASAVSTFEGIHKENI